MAWLFALIIATSSAREPTPRPEVELRLPPIERPQRGPRALHGSAPHRFRDDEGDGPPIEPSTETPPAANVTPAPTVEASPPAIAPAPPEDDPASSFKQAYDDYLAGAFARAREGLLGLVARDASMHDVPEHIYAESMIFLGELAYHEGDREGAEAMFRMLLTREPTTPISPYDHPDYIIGVFELVRGAVLAERSQRPVERVALPVWGYAPLGIPQFKQGHPVRGALAATFQVGFIATSVASWVWIDRLVNTWEGLTDSPPSAREDFPKALAIQGGLAIPSAALFYVTWGASVADGGMAWRRDHRPDLTLGVTPTADGMGLVLGGRW
jgi:hypothetical protein